MSLERERDILAEADRHGTAVLAFDAMNYAMIAAAVQGAAAAKRPVIVMLYPEMAGYVSLEGFLALVKEQARQVRIPVGIHLDHCSDFAYIVRALKAGFPSVMADGSLLPLDENIAFTASVVRTAKAFGADVEGELGHVGKAANEGDYIVSDLYTPVEEARVFAEATGVTALAIAFGSAHGNYKRPPKLDITRLKEINQAVKTPLVLHGGSGIPKEQLTEAFHNGINKFNVGTEFSYLNQKYTGQYFEQEMERDGACGHVEYAREKLSAYIAEKCRLTTCTAEPGTTGNSLEEIL